MTLAGTIPDLIIPAIHLEQSASFILDWNGLRLPFSGDTPPNKWWIEHTQGVDLSIRECFFPPHLAIAKWGFSKMEQVPVEEVSS